MMDNSQRALDERRYVHLAPETICNVAEAIGIGGLSTAVAKELAEDVTYRLREISDVCSQFLRHSRKRKLTTDILNKAFKCKNIEPVIGHKKSRILGCDSFEYLPEGEIFVESDREINLVNESLHTNQCLEESRVTVSASWIALQGIPLNSLQDEGKVNPTQISISSSLLQYYTTSTSHILNESEQLCLAVIQDLRSNPRLTPLLPYFVTFSRVCLNRYKENSVLTARLIRLISALFSNPYINLSPKPYLSSLVSALLGFLIKENKDISTIEHVQLAACVLSQALHRWATPTNQLRAQTLRALKENCGNNLYYSQYGSLYSLYILGPQVLDECLKAPFEILLTNLEQALAQDADRGRKTNCQLGNWSLGLLKCIGSTILKYWIERRVDCSAIGNLYLFLSDHFADSVVPYICEADEASLTARKRPQFGKVRIRKVRILNQPTSSRMESGDMFGAPRNIERGFFSSQENFNYLADMGVPSDIFETADLEATDRHENDFSVFFKPRIVNLSKSLSTMFPDARPFKFRARAIKLNMGPCRQLEPDRYNQKRPVQSHEKGRRMVAWRNFVVGRRIGCQRQRRLSTIPDYINLIAFP